MPCVTPAGSRDCPRTRTAQSSKLGGQGWRGSLAPLGQTLERGTRSWPSAPCSALPAGQQRRRTSKLGGVFTGPATTLRVVRWANFKGVELGGHVSNSWPWSPTWFCMHGRH